MRRPLAPFHSVALLALASLPLLALAQAPAEPAKPAEAPAAKPAPIATLYGTLNVNFQITSATGATTATQDVKSRNAVSTDSSNIGVRGNLKVDEWVGATFQCETSANVDGIGASGICNRNSRLGLSGPWGTLFYGNWDTPFKAATYGTKADDPFEKTDTFGYQGIMGSPGFNYRSGGWSTASNSSTMGFDVRANNSVAYHSPKFHGLSAKLQYSADEFKNFSGTRNPELYGAVINFDYGLSPAIAVSVLAAYERHHDGFALAGINPVPPPTPTTTPPTPPVPYVPLFGATTTGNTTGSNTVPNGSTDSAWRVGAGVQIDSPAGATTVSGMYEQLTLEQDRAPAGAITEYKRSAWQVALKHRYGDHELRGRYSQAAAGDVTLNGGGGSTTDYGASQFALGYAYYFTASLQGYLHYTQIKNEANAQYTLTIGGSPAVAGSTPKGADPSAVGLGLRWAF